MRPEARRLLCLLIPLRERDLVQRRCGRRGQRRGAAARRAARAGTDHRLGRRRERFDGRYGHAGRHRRREVERRPADGAGRRGAPNRSIDGSPAAFSAEAISTNGPPVAQDDTATPPFGTPVVIDALAHDPDGDPLTVGSVTAPANGAAAINADQTVTYTPDAGFHGVDGFQYTINDGHGHTASATVTVTVQAPVRACNPVAGYNQTWQGSVSTDWSHAGNWSPAGAPGVGGSASICRQVLRAASVLNNQGTIQVGACDKEPGHTINGTDPC